MEQNTPRLLTEAEALELYINLPRADYISALRERGLIADEPVVPLLIEAREIAGIFAKPDWAVIAKEGYYDNTHVVRSTLAALRRGRELAKPLTREMVVQAVSVNVNVGAHVNYDCIYAALVEQMK